MNLIRLDFGTIMWIILGLALFGLANWVVQGFARFSERFVIDIVRAGSPGLAKGLLAVLIGFTATTYQKPRFIIWNQVHVRFVLLWGGFLLLAVVLLLLHVGRTVDSVGQTWLIAFSAYIGFRCLLYWMRPKTDVPSREQSAHSLIQHVNERSRPDYQQALIRRWDYLDELFAGSV